jgi:hypothetical protein
MTGEPQGSASDLAVLHTLRCIGAAGAERVAEACARPVFEVESELIDLAVAGLVTHYSGPFGGWSLTDDGRDDASSRIAAQLDAAGAREVVAAAHDAFASLNNEALAICSAWQLRPVGGATEINDHTDHRHDDHVLRRLAVLDKRVQPICANLTEALPRFGGYGPRLASAARRAQAGEVAAVAVGLDSYHAVWFQLHEDLLVTLGITRW